MSDQPDGNVPQEDVDREFEQARQMLADAKRASEVDISKATVVNRLYYACFHAAQGSLYAHGYNPQSHGAVQTLLGRELIQGGAVAREQGRFYNEMETYRRRVDYGSGSVERATAELIEQTESFVTAMEETATGAE